MVNQCWHFSVIMYLLLVFLVPIHADLLTPVEFVESEQLAKFVTDVFVSECRPCQAVWVFHMDDDLTCNLFLQKVAITSPATGFFLYKLDNFTATQTGDYPGYIPEMTIIFLSNNYNAIDDILYEMEALPFWNPRGRYLLIATGVNNPDEEWIELSFKALWDRQILRALICYWQKNLKIYSYNPFLNNYGTDSSNNTNLSEILHHKIKNMNGYPIKLYYYDLILTRNCKKPDGKWVGPDGLFFETFGETINASVEVHFLSEDFSYDIIKNTDMTRPVGTYLDVFRELYDFDAIFSVGNIYDDNTYDRIFVRERNDLFIVVPRSEKIPEYLYIYYLVPSTVWAAIIASLISVSAVIVYIHKINSKKVDTIRVFMDNCRLLLNESIPDIKRQPQENFLILLWLLLCIVLATLFHTTLISTLLVPKYYPEIETLDDLYKTNLDIWIPTFTHVKLNTVIVGDNSPLIERLRIVPREVSFIGDDMDWIEHYRYNSAVVIDTAQIETLKRRLPIGARAKFHVIENSVLPSIAGYTIGNQKLYLNELQLIYDRIVESGLNDHWGQYNFGMKLVRENTSNYDTDGGDDDVKALSFNNLQSVFILLLAGYCLAAIAFCLELVVELRKRRHNK